MYRFVFFISTAITLSSCKTGGLIPGKFEAADGERPFQAIASVIEMFIAAL